MKVLGLTPACAHDSSAALVVDGRVVAAAEEERFTRVKHDGRFPAQAAQFCLEQGGLTWPELDCVAVPWFGFNVHSPYRDLALAFRRVSGQRRAALATFVDRWVGRRLDRERRLGHVVYGSLGELTTRYPSVPAVRYVDHHRAHAATAFYPSGFREAAVVTIDGGGHFWSTVAWQGRGGRLRALRAEPVTNSAGFFLQLTRFLSLGDFGEGKTMGLSSYGHADPAMTERVKRHIFDADGGTWYQERLYSPARPRDIGLTALDIPARPKEEPILQPPYTDLAYAAQRELEQAYVRVARYAVERAGSRDLCLSGGVALNCLANSAVLEQGVADRLFVFPASHDGGTSVGAALAVSAEHGRPVQPMEHAYWGPAYSDQEVEQELSRSSLPFTRETDIAATAARLLAEGKVLGWFQGRMELGPRALGNRSILADPRRAAMTETVNRIKGREAWRPLAPAILQEAMHRYLERAVASPFMLLSFTVKAAQRAAVPAIVHVDGSTRPQTVERSTNPRLWTLIQRFERLTGIPLVLNTSFNLAGDPIVCHPRDAIDSFRRSQLDALVLGDYLAVR